VSFEAGDVATVRALAGAGLGIAILPALRQPALPVLRPRLA
jgi:DNA-binding transcriptional LysR family regulator